MNRRKMFGILAAPVAAANIPVQSEVKTDLKPYSAYDYNDILRAWCNSFLRSYYEFEPDAWNDGYPCIHVDDDLGNGRWFLHTATDQKWVERHINLLCTTNFTNQAFADACLNGEVPGVWWE